MCTKVLTINLRYETEEDGPNNWPFRKEHLASLINSLKPDIFGSQEGWEQQIYELQRLLPDYKFYVDAPKEWNKKRMYPCVWVKKGRIEAEQVKTIWLSETPHLPHSKNWGSAFPRTLTYVVAKDIQGKRFIFASTHLDHISEIARPNQATVLIDHLKDSPLPIILVGDFNAAPKSHEHEILTSHFQDAWEMMGKEDMTTYCSFTGKDVKGRIDWILITPGIEVKEIEVIKKAFDGRYSSDHFPVVATLKI
jgi:endonuclease/exonuclease/phosphatase family metal-dependent hydrolase